MSKERPILFQGEMVRATLDNRKTQTRRTRGLDEVNADRSAVFVRMQVLKCGNLAAIFENGNGELGSVKSPYGKPGDRLWVRETHYVERAANTGETGFILYKASDDKAPVSKWRPSIHMPRWASRITLEVESVRVERLQEISEEDAMAEGIIMHEATLEDDAEFSYMQDGFVYESAKEAYRYLWESINGPGSWDANPFVWCISFRKL